MNPDTIAFVVMLIGSALMFVPVVIDCWRETRHG